MEASDALIIQIDDEWMPRGDEGVEAQVELGGTPRKQKGRHVLAHHAAHARHRCTVAVIATREDDTSAARSVVWLDNVPAVG